jgi:hypothetical protein
VGLDLQGAGTSRGLPVNVLAAVAQLVATDPVNENGVREDPTLDGNITLPTECFVRQLILAQNAGIDKELCVGMGLLTGGIQTEQVTQSGW